MDRSELTDPTEEIVGAIAWTEKLCKDPGPKPPLTVLAALKAVVDMKLRYQKARLELRERVRLSREDVEKLTRMLQGALVRAELPEHYRVRLIEELRRGAWEEYGE